jgi:hypothetical protein
LHTNYPNVAFAANLSYDPLSYGDKTDELLQHVDILVDEQGFTHGNNHPGKYLDAEWLSKVQHLQKFLDAGQGWFDMEQQPVSFANTTPAERQWSIANYLW